VAGAPGNLPPANAPLLGRRGGPIVCAWQLPGNALRQDTAAFEAFKQLLGVLTARQHPLGLQVNQLVGQS